MYIQGVWISFSSCLSVVISTSCGIDNYPAQHVNAGIYRLEYYPWLGVLYYPYSDYKFTTAVVLITRQVVLAAATEIDKLPKKHFRAEARVTIGYNCSGPAVGVRDYVYHPDYSKDTFSTLALIQLETDHFTIELRPICPPPTHFKDQNFFAMVLSDNCKQSQVRIHKMKYVSPQQCKTYYRRTGRELEPDTWEFHNTSIKPVFPVQLDVNTLWPSYTACAKSVSGDRCVWRSGAILVVKVGKRWRLLGFGVYGPGCRAPARFLDYGMHHAWVRQSIDRIGRPAITSLKDNHIIIRKTTGNVQRFGPCDFEEMNQQLYTETNKIKAHGRIETMSHNVTLHAGIEYSCVIIKADYSNDFEKQLHYEKPVIRVRRWCSDETELCHGLALLDINLILEIKFKASINLHVTAYSKNADFIEPNKAIKSLNKDEKLVKIMSYDKTKEKFQPLLWNATYLSYGSGVYGSTFWFWTS